MENIIKALNRRYATGLYDTTKKVSDEDLNTILEAMRLTPSSFGLQPWKFIVVTNPELRAQLKEHSH
jgi:nitroreductase